MIQLLCYTAERGSIATLLIKTRPQATTDALKRHLCIAQRITHLLTRLCATLTACAPRPCHPPPPPQTGRG